MLPAIPLLLFACGFSPEPAAPVDGDTGWSTFEAGGILNCALDGEGYATCWGLQGVRGEGLPRGPFAALAVGMSHA